MIGSYAKTGRVPVTEYQRTKFRTRYTESDTKLLAYVDKAHGGNLSGPLRLSSPGHCQKAGMKPSWKGRCFPEAAIRKPPSSLNILPDFAAIRIVVMEYNSSFLRSVALTVPLNHRHDSLKGVFYGASLAALNSLLENDYALVGCTRTGVNAFWVRRDLDLSQFAEPFIAGEPFSGLAVPSPSRQSGGLGSGVGKRRRRFSSLNSIY